MVSKNILSLSNLYDASAIGAGLYNPALGATMGIGKILFQQLSLSTDILQKNTESLKCKFDSLTETEKNDLAMMAYNMHMQAINGLSEDNLDLLSKLIANQIKKDDIDISKDKYNKFSKIVAALDKEEIIVISEVVEAYKYLYHSFYKEYELRYYGFFDILVLDNYLYAQETKVERFRKHEIIQAIVRTSLFKTYSSGNQAIDAGEKYCYDLSITALFKEFIKYIDETAIDGDK